MVPTMHSFHENMGITDKLVFILAKNTSLFIVQLWLVKLLICKQMNTQNIVSHYNDYYHQS